MRSGRLGISVAASSPASSVLSQRYRLRRVGKSGSRRQASGTLSPLLWNSQSIPSRPPWCTSDSLLDQAWSEILSEVPFPLFLVKN